MNRLMLTDCILSFRHTQPCNSVIIDALVDADYHPQWPGRPKQGSFDLCESMNYSARYFHIDNYHYVMYHCASPSVAKGESVATPKTGTEMTVLEWPLADYCLHCLASQSMHGPYPT